MDPTEPPVNKPFVNMQAVNGAQALLASVAANKLAPSCPKGKIFDDIETCDVNCPGRCALVEFKKCKACSDGAEIESKCTC